MIYKALSKGFGGVKGVTSVRFIGLSGRPCANLRRKEGWVLKT